MIKAILAGSAVLLVSLAAMAALPATAAAMASGVVVLAFGK